MPTDFLHSIEYHDFPLHVTDRHGLECLRVLHAARLVEATFVVSQETGIDTAAEVKGITEKGRVALAQRAQGKPFP
jgi:L-arabinose isomerase